MADYCGTCAFCLAREAFRVDKLKAIMHYYDRHRVPKGTFLRNAFNLLLEQTGTRISNDSKIWKMLEPIIYNIPVFPYRVQLVYVWDEETNWRVLQASAHQDIINLLYTGFLKFGDVNVLRILRNAPAPINMFDYYSNRNTEQIDQGSVTWKGSLGVVMETVRTFLVEWLVATAEKPNWEPDVPKECVEFNIAENFLYDYSYLSWTCQRELRKQISKMWKEDRNFAGEAALIMLFILGFPLLRMEWVEMVILRQKTEKTRYNKRAPHHPQTYIKILI